MQDRTGLTVFLVRVVFVLFETRRFCKVARFVFPDLQQLIQNQYKEILAREKNNDKFIHLYDIGAYWVAFERSACRLSGLFSKSELTLFRVPDCVEYVVMVSVPADEAEGCLGEYIILHDGIYRKVWSEHVLPMGDYRHWHEMAVRSVLL